MKILVYKWKSYNYADMIADLSAMGYTVDVIEQELESYDEDAEFAACLRGMLAQKSYDFVFTVNYFAVISNVCEQCHIRYVIWTCDNPLISMYHKSIYNDCNYIFTFDKTNYLEFKGMGAAHIWHLPLAADTQRLDALLNDASDLDKYENEISFIGNLYEHNTYDEIEAELPDYLRGYLDAVVQAQLNISGGNIIEEMLKTDILEQLQEQFRLEKSADSFSDLGLIFATTVLGFKVAAVQRTQALLALSKKYPVSLYSNSPSGHLIRVRQRGSVDYWSQMPKIFRASKINLNFTIPNIKSGLPLRMWDILGAKGFLLTNYQAEIPYYFEIGKDLACYESERELVEKCGYYLAHEEERRQIAQNGYEKVRTQHSIRRRLEFILQKIQRSDNIL